MMKYLILGLCFLLSFSAFSENYKDLSFEKLVTTAESGDEVAMGFLAESYKAGRGVTKDLEKAKKWNKKAAELNYAPAQYNLAVMLYDEVSLKQDLPQAFFWAEKAAEQNNIAAQFLVASMYEQGKGVFANKQQASKWYKHAANQHHSQAQFNLAIMLIKGDGIKRNSKLGLEWLNKAANQNHAQAKSVLNLIKNNNQ